MVLSLRPWQEFTSLFHEIVNGDRSLVAWKLMEGFFQSSGCAVGPYLSQNGIVLLQQIDKTVILCAIGVDCTKPVGEMKW
jgi:hypothetical protein